MTKKYITKAHTRVRNGKEYKVKEHYKRFRKGPLKKNKEPSVCLSIPLHNLPPAQAIRLVKMLDMLDITYTIEG